LIKAYAALAWLAFAWAIANCVYVYTILDGNEMHRVESALVILAVVLVPVVVTGANPPTAIRLSTTQTALAVGTATAVWALILLPQINFPFLSDDYVFLDRYTSVANAINSPFFFRPLFALMFMTLATIGRGSPIPFHVVSLALHAASASLVYSLARQLFRSSAAATICFAVFLLNPMQLEASLWVSGLQELLWTFFLLAALRCYVSSETLSGRRIAAISAALVGALASKETAICFVLLLPSADLAFGRLERVRQRMWMYALFGTMAVIYLLIRRRFVTIDSDFFVTPSRYFLKQFSAVPYHFFPLPWNASIVDPPWIVPLALSVVAIALVFALAMRNPSPRALTGPVLMLIASMPMYSYFFVRPDLLAARYLYFPTIGWSVLLAEALLSAAPRRSVLLAVTLGLVVLLGVTLNLNLQPWRTGASLVDTLRAGVEKGRRPATIIADWQHATGAKVVMKNGVPYEYEGVGVFINGYDQFLRMHGSRIDATRP
jgi:hypothetical protein